MVKERPDLKKYAGQKLTVIAWLWVRTVKSPNPAFSHIDVPLTTKFMLSTKPGKEAYVEPVIESDGYRFTVKIGKPENMEAVQGGTKLARGANFRCIMSGTPIEEQYIKRKAWPDAWERVLWRSLLKASVAASICSQMRNTNRSPSKHSRLGSQINP